MDLGCSVSPVASPTPVKQEGEGVGALKSPLFSLHFQDHLLFPSISCHCRFSTVSDSCFLGGLCDLLSTWNPLGVQFQHFPCPDLPFSANKALEELQFEWRAGENSRLSPRTVPEAENGE